MEQEKELLSLIEQSQDLNSDALKATKESLDELVDRAKSKRQNPVEAREELDEFREKRRKFLATSSGFAGSAILAAIGTGLLSKAMPALASSSSTDIEILQTAASIENLAVLTYQKALGLPFIGGSSANGVVKAFATTTQQQHQQHGSAFNNAIKALGGKEQNNPDPVLLQLVQSKLPTLQGPGDVVALAIQLEEGAAETYVANVSALSDHNARQVTASIMGVEAQHVAILNAVQALLNANLANLIALPPNAAMLPGAAGSVGFPNSFYSTQNARPENEGAVS